MSTSASAHPARAVRLVALREINTRLRTRSFLVGTVAILAVLAGYVLLQATLIGDENTVRIGLSGQATNLASPIESAAREFGTVTTTAVVSNAEDARAKVTSGELDAVVSGSTAELQVLVKSDIDPNLRMALSDISRQELLTAKLAEAGVPDPATVLAEADAVTVAVVALEQADPERAQRQVVGLIAAVLLFVSISTYGGLVAQGVIEEKSSKVVEILISTIQPWQLLLGKVAGLGLVGLTQLVIIAVAGLVTAAAAGVLTVSGAAIGVLLWSVLWFVVGFFLYATIFAAVGSLVSRQEDAQSVLTPVTLTMMVGVVVGLNVMLSDPHGAASVALSLVPLYSPILMPGRIAAGGVAGWEIGLALVLTTATVGAGIWLGGRVYRNAVLRTGSRVRLADALRG